jgi:hypothetical protein
MGTVAPTPVVIPVRCAPKKAQELPGSGRLCAVEGVGLQWVQFPPGNWVAPTGVPGVSHYRFGGVADE